MIKKLKDRRVIIAAVFVVVFVIIAYRLATITITQGDYYYEQSINNRIRKVDTLAKRGDIYDINGNLLAASDVGFTVKYYKESNDNQKLNDAAIETINILDHYGEKYYTFPIMIDENGNFTFTFDQNIANWKASNNYPEDYTAEQVFYEAREQNFISSEMSDYEAYNILYNKGIYLPIATYSMTFNEENNKSKFFDMYNVEEGANAEEAFYKIVEYYDIQGDYSIKSLHSIITFRHLIKEKGYYGYEPVVIASDISKETAVAIRERSMELAGVQIEGVPKRTYPESDVASHVLGYMGHISSAYEIDKFVKEYDYDKNTMIGKTGIEGTYELELSGENGYEYVAVDVFGQKVGEVDEEAMGLEYKKSKAGKDIVLSIDLELQKTLEESLEKIIKQIQVGGMYESEWGNYYYDAFPNAETGAGVVVDVKTGKVLAMASYPDYDLNLFATGISQDDWNSLSPANPRNPLAPRALYNLSTMMVVQPGSIYKMITGYAALEAGLDPYQKFYTNGKVELGNRSYACWYFNDYGGVHGATNLIDAIEVSCNYFMFDISTAFDYYRDRPINIDMGPDRLIEESKKFGLDDKTGIEIAEQATGVPDPQRKKQNTLYFMKIQLKEIAKDYFPAEITEDDDKLNEVIDTIISWSDENPPRGDLINRLIELGSSDDYYQTAKLADIIKYDYFNLVEWYDGDTLNLSIGQGDHTYTPVQMARYIMAIANNGYLYELSLVDSVGGVKVDKTVGVTNDAIMSNDNLKYIQEGMYKSANGTRGTSAFYLRDFPIETAGKTGTAEKEGLIPPIDEVEYLKTHLHELTYAFSQEQVDEKTIEIIKDRSNEMAELDKIISSDNASEEEKIKAETQLNNYIRNDYLNKGDAMREAIKSLSNYTITDEDINQFRVSYESYAWYASYAPYDDPEIAVVILIPQGGHGGYSVPIVREVYAKYFGLNEETSEATDENIQEGE